MDFSSFESSTPHYEFAEEVPDWVRTLMSMNNFPGAGFHDIYVPRFGAEFLLNKYLTLRGGYWYQPTPVPDQRGITNYADADRHSISVGGSVSAFLPRKYIDGPIRIDFVFQAQILEKRMVTKDDPEDPVGNYSISGETFFGGAYLKYIF